MKRIIYLLVIFMTCLWAQSQDVVQWDFSYNPETKSVEMKATIEEGWHLYSQYVDNEVGPVPTSFTFQSSDFYELKGKVAEPKPIQRYDETFGANLDFFENEVVFSQKVKVNKASVLEGSVVFMVCNDTMCLPPVDKTFKIDIPQN